MSWNYKVDIKQFLSDSEDPAEVKRIAPLIAAELRKAMPFRNDFEDPAGEEAIIDIERAKTVEEFNDALDAVYDHADAYRVWLGLRIQRA